jgi:hypothetical protein
MPPQSGCTSSGLTPRRVGVYTRSACAAQCTSDARWERVKLCGGVPAAASGPFAFVLTHSSASQSSAVRSGPMARRRGASGAVTVAARVPVR